MEANNKGKSNEFEYGASFTGLSSIIRRLIWMSTS